MAIRLFTAGTHNSLDFSNVDIENIYKGSIGAGRIPFVLGHPQNDLPILGWLERSKIRLYDEGDKKSIGFDRRDAEFSENSLSVLKRLKQNKISVRLSKGVIMHAGLVETPAVIENKYQDFSGGDKLGMDLCFSAGSELVFEEEKVNDFKALIKEIKQIFNYKKNEVMNKENESAKDFSAENEAVKMKLENLQLRQELEALKKATADFEAKVKSEKLEKGKKDLAEKIKVLGYDEAKAKDVKEFGDSLLEKDDVLFGRWLGGLEATKATVQVVNGSVTAGDFEAHKCESLEAAIDRQVKSIK